MKRIAFLGFVVFVLPILWVSCYRCGKDGPVNQKWTWDNLQITATKTFDGVVLSNGDTVTTDSIYFSCQLISKAVAVNRDFESSMYSAIACDPVINVTQINPIKKVVFGIGSITSIDISIESSLSLHYINQNFQWDKDQKRFLDVISRESSRSSNRVIGQFQSPHDSKPVQIIMMAIKQNGDTLKAFSEEIVLK